MKNLAITALLALLCLQSCNTHDKPVTIGSLLDEMVDREALARFPDRNYTVGQFSSYDRRMVDKDQPHWFSNWDRSWFIRSEMNAGRKEYVMMEAQTPGALVRFWMTFAGQNCGRGTLRIYIDDYATPVIEGAAFDILSGGLVTGAPLSTSVSALTAYEHRGHNLYLPIPYAQRCKVTYQSDNVREDDPGARDSENVYYNINYRTYTPETVVESYSAASMQKYAAKIDAVQQLLAAGASAPIDTQTEAISLDCRLEPGTSQSFTHQGPAAVRNLRLCIAAADRAQALRSLILSIRFDGEQTVWVPAGDFFGVGCRNLASQTWYTHCTPEGLMQALWVMPFAQECTITLSNCGQEPLDVVQAEARFSDWQWDARSMHFGAGWHQYTHIDTGAGQDMEGLTPGPQDLNFVSLTGKGVYVGDGVALFNTADAWWGEGDEKIYVDGEKFPSHIGTGTEDYYGYAWCRPENFTGHPFIAQPDGSGNLNAGYTVNSRYRSLDAIPFTQSLVFDLELWHWAHTTIDYAPVTYWYMLPGGRSNQCEELVGAQAKVTLQKEDILTR